MRTDALIFIFGFSALFPGHAAAFAWSATLTVCFVTFAF
jgi:hypothetical protein